MLLPGGENFIALEIRFIIILSIASGSIAIMHSSTFVSNTNTIFFCLAYLSIDDMFHSIKLIISKFSRLILLCFFSNFVVSIRLFISFNILYAFLFILSIWFSHLLAFVISL